MIDWVIDNAFGVWGRAIMNFYLEYAVPINSVVVCYGVFLVFLHLKTRSFRFAATDEAKRIISGYGNPVAGPKLYTYVAERMKWDKVFESGKANLIAGRWGLWPIKATADNLKKVLPVSELCRDALAELKKQSTR